MCCDDFEIAEIDNRVWRRARKEHTCCACKETIRRGDKYHYTSSLYEGNWDSYKHCARCYAICKALWSLSDVNVIDYELNCGELWSDNFGPEPPEVAKLAFMTADEMQQELEIDI